MLLSTESATAISRKIEILNLVRSAYLVSGNLFPVKVLVFRQVVHNLLRLALRTAAWNYFLTSVFVQNIDRNKQYFILHIVDLRFIGQFSCFSNREAAKKYMV